MIRKLRTILKIDSQIGKNASQTAMRTRLIRALWRSVCCLCLTLASAFRRSKMFLMDSMAPWMPVCVRPCTITKVSSTLLLVITLILLSDSILVICCPFWPMMCFMCVLSMVIFSVSNGLGTGDGGVVVC